MKPDIHPTYYPDAQVICVCGNTWTTGSTQKVVRTEVCYKCHPFFTGEQRIVDTEGQVDRFYKKLQARQEFLAQQEAKRLPVSPRNARLPILASASALRIFSSKPGLPPRAMCSPPWKKASNPCSVWTALAASPWRI